MMEKMPKVDNSGPLTGQYHLIPGRPTQSIPTPLDPPATRNTEETRNRYATECGAIADQIIAKYPSIVVDKTGTLGIVLTIPASLNAETIARQFNCVLLPIRSGQPCPTCPKPS